MSRATQIEAAAEAMWARDWGKDATAPHAATHTPRPVDTWATEKRHVKDSYRELATLALRAAVEAR